MLTQSSAVVVFMLFACVKECLALHLPRVKSNQGQMTLDVLKQGLQKSNLQGEGFFDTVDFDNQNASKYLEPLIKEIIRSKLANGNFGTIELPDRQPKKTDEKVNYVSDPQIKPPSAKNLTLNNSVSTVYPSSLIDDEDSDLGSGNLEANGSGENGAQVTTEGSGSTLNGKEGEEAKVIDIKEILRNILPPKKPTYYKKQSTTKPIVTTNKSNVLPTYYPPRMTPPPHLFSKNDLRKTIQIYYYGPCLFCYQQLQQQLLQQQQRQTHHQGQPQQQQKQSKISSNEWKNNKRKKILQKILNFDFVILVQKHPSGMFTTLLSFGLGRTLFPEYTYLQIHPPIACSCFSRAPNKRYLLVGEFYHGRMVLNNFHPLYEIDSFVDIEEIQRAMRH